MQYRDTFDSFIYVITVVFFDDKKCKNEFLGTESIKWNKNNRKGFDKFLQKHSIL